MFRLAELLADPHATPHANPYADHHVFRLAERYVYHQELLVEQLYIIIIK